MCEGTCFTTNLHTFVAETVHISDVDEVSNLHFWEKFSRGLTDSLGTNKSTVQIFFLFLISSYVFRLNYDHQRAYIYTSKTAIRRLIAVSFSNIGTRSLMMAAKPNYVAVNWE